MLVDDLILSPKISWKYYLTPKENVIFSVEFFTSLPSNYTCTTKEIVVGNILNPKREKKPTNLSASSLRVILLFSLPCLLFCTGNSRSTAYSCSQGLNHGSIIMNPECHLPLRYVMKHLFQSPTLFSFPILRRSGMLTG